MSRCIEWPNAKTSKGYGAIVRDGKTQPVNDEFFQRLGGGYDGAIGTTASWVVAGLMCLAMAWAVFSKRRNQQRFGVQSNPLWVDLVVLELQGKEVMEESDLLLLEEVLVAEVAAPAMLAVIRQVALLVEMEDQEPHLLIQARQ